MFFRKWRERRAERAAVAEVMGAMMQAVIEGGRTGADGDFDLGVVQTVPLFETVEWEKSAESWFVCVVHGVGGESWERGSYTGEMLPVGQRVSLMSGRGGRMEDALVVGVEVVSTALQSPVRAKYYLDFEATGGAEPWFARLLES